MTDENGVPYATEWGTTWDGEIRELQQDWDAVIRKSKELKREHREAEDRLAALIMRARKEGWCLSKSHMFYGRDFRHGSIPGKLSQEFLDKYPKAPTPA